MVAKFYLGTPYLHPQENAAFHYLCSVGAEIIGDREDVRIIGNVNCNNCPMDALVLGHRSITIIDFKDYGGTIQVSENSVWRTSEGIDVRGGSYRNPYKQVQQYKRGLRQWLEANRLLSDANDLSHISGLVIFTQPKTHIDAAAMRPTANKWFCAADFVDGISFLRNRTSPSLTLSSNCMDMIVAKLRLEPFIPKQSERFVPVSELHKARREAFAASQALDDDRMLNWWEKNANKMRKEYEEACQQWYDDDPLFKDR